MTRADYLAMLRVQGPIWAQAQYDFWWREMPYWALSALYDYLTGKVAQ